MKNLKFTKVWVPTTTVFVEPSDEVSTGYWYTRYGHYEYVIEGEITVHNIRESKIVDEPEERPSLREQCDCRGGPHGGYTCPGCRG